MLSSNCLADNDTWINIHLASLHAKNTVEVEGTTYELNEFNPGLGWQAAGLHLSLFSGGLRLRHTNQ